MKLEKIKKVLFYKLVFRLPSKHHAYHYGHNLAHCTYLGAVFHKAPYSVYGWAAGALLILVVIGFFIGEEIAE